MTTFISGRRACLIVFLLSTATYGQTVLLSLGSGVTVAGGAVNLNLSLSSSTTRPTALQWTFSYTSGSLTVSKVIVGPAGVAAGKSIYCASSTAGTYTCLLAGINSNTIANGVVAVATFQVPAASSIATLPIQLTKAMSASVAGVGLPTSTAGGVITMPAQLSVAQLTCSPASLTGAVTSVCTVRLSASAPNSVTVTLSSNKTALKVPASVIVPAGASTATFSATASAVTADTTVQLTATMGGTSANATVSLLGPAALSSITCSSATISPGGTSTCTVTLSKTTTSAFPVALASSSAVVTVPASVTVAAGVAKATFTATAGATVGNATITATAAGLTRTASLTVASVQVTALTCTPASVTLPTTITCTLTLNLAAPTNGLTVALSSNNSAVKPPVSATVLAGTKTVSFKADTFAVAADTTVQLTATANGISTKATITVLTPPVLNSLACTPTTLNPGGTSTCTVALTKKAVTPFIVTVVSSSTALKVPASVTVPVGASSVTFTTTASTTSTTIRTYGIIVTAGGVSQAVYIVIAPISTASDTGAPQPAALTCGPNPLSFPAALVCRVEIDPAPANPVAMTLSSDSDKLELPDPIIVRPGITHVPFIAFSKENAGAETILITASIGDANVSTGVILAESLEPAPAEPGQAETNGAPGSPRITSVVNAATLSPEAACSPGSIAVVLGSGLASSSPDAARSVRVRINGEDTPVLAASPTRVSFLCPAWAPGTDMSIVVENELGSSDAVPASMHSVSPGILTLDNTGKGQGLIMLAGTKELAAIASPVVHGSPVRPGELVSIFATGLGASEGTSVLVLLDSVPAEVTYLGLIPDRPGLYRIDAKVPRAVARADRVPVQLRIPLIDGRWAESNQVTMSIDGPPVNDE